MNKRSVRCHICHECIHCLELGRRENWSVAKDSGFLEKKKQPERMKLQAALSVETDLGDDADVVTEEPITR